MCSLFGFYNYSKSDIKGLLELTNKLAQEATIRGTDATGISYNYNNNLVIHKEPKSAYKMKFKHPENTIAVMGHTRHSTQGSEKKNFNNHPFMWKCKNSRFTLAHNGIISNDDRLRKEYKIPKTKIETDSYIAVQLIEKKKQLDNESIKFMSENVHGSFTFSILDDKNTLYLIKGDNPLSIIHFPKYKLYVYASTDEILCKAILGTNLFKEIKQGNFEEIEINSGEILIICTCGKILRDKFKYTDYSYCGLFDWSRYEHNFFEDDSDYITDLKSVSKYYGYEPDDIDVLIEEGFSPEEIEEFIYT